MQILRYLPVTLCLILSAGMLSTGMLHAKALHSGYPVTVKKTAVQTTQQIAQAAAQNRRHVAVPNVGDSADARKKLIFKKSQNKHAKLVSSSNGKQAKSLQPKQPLMAHYFAKSPFPSQTNLELFTPNFTAVTFDDSGFFPPDAMGVVGPQQFIVTVNGRIRSFDKLTGEEDGLIDETTDAFFASVLPTGSSTTDPQIRYDRLTDRWFIVMGSVPDTAVTNDILIAVSDTGFITPDTVWQFFSFSPIAGLFPGATPFADFPTLGLDAQALYIGANIFDQITDNYITSDAFVINKTLLIGGTLFGFEFSHLVNPATGAGPVSPQGVENFDVGAATGFFIGVDGNMFGRLVLRTIHEPASANPQISDNIFITVPSTAQPLNVPHLKNNNGQNGYLEANDDSLSASHIRNHRLYTTHNIGVNEKGISSTHIKLSRTGSRWYEIDVKDHEKPELLQAGTLFQKGVKNSKTARSYWMPSVMTNGLHTLALGASVAGTHHFANAAFALRFNDDKKGTLRDPIVFTNSQAAYNPPFDPGSSARARRWGDYSHTSCDPLDNMTLWTIQEFTSSANTWGCQVVRIPAPPPPLIVECHPSTISKNEHRVTLKIKGKDSESSAFYDPGLGFKKRLKVTIGDLKILSVTSESANELKVVVSTVGVSKGRKEIVVTNPDGQKVRFHQFKVE